MQPVCEDFFETVDQSPRPAPRVLNAAVRGYLAAARTHLLGLHDDGTPASRVNEEHAELVDRLVRKLFRVSEDAYHSRFARLDLRIAIVALGGYGRRELSLASDVDLLILHRGKLNPYVETIAEGLSYRLWDARVALSCATRTVADCIRVGQQDLPTMTSYLDSRFLAGDAGLAAEFERAVRDWIRERPVEFLRGKREEQQRRHERFGESPFLLQPNVREGVGGLRDAHTALWLARVAHWEVRRPEHLRIHGFVDDQECSEFVEALEFLWRVRNELHRDGRKYDRLHYGAQEQLAKVLGFLGTEAALPVEEFMRAYYLHARTIERVSTQVVDHAFQLVDRSAGQADPGPRSLEEGFVLSDGRLEVPHPRLLRERPVRLLSVFAVAQRNDVDLSPRALRLVRDHVELIDDGLREDPEAANVFREILRGKNRVYRTLVAMNDIGVLGAYLPEFGSVRGLWQQDLYHTYTVDVHSLFLIEQLRRLENGRYAEELPLVTELVHEVRARDVVFLACLLHDVGKGKGGGHSVRGAQMVPALARRLGLDDGESSHCSFLVLHHLHMSRLAERRDVNDPRLILNLAKLVGNRRQLRNLYLLTVADIRSVSREAWTPWKGGLLEALYRNTADWIEADVSDEAAPAYFLERAIARGEITEAHVLAALGEAGIAEERGRALVDSFSRRYLLSHEPEQIVAHMRAAQDFLDRELVVGVYVQPVTDAGAQGCEFLVFSPDRPGLFSIVAGLLAAAGRNVESAYVYTSREGLAMEIYRVVAAGGPEEEEKERARLEERLGEVLAGRKTVEALLAGRPGHRPGPARVQPPVVRISNEDSDLYSIVDVTTQDRPGLLYDLTRTLANLGLNVVMSRVSTRANRVSDAFYVTDDGHKILDEGRRDEIQKLLLAAVQAGTP